MEYEVKDRNEWFEEVERAYSKLKIVERPYAPPHAAVAVEAEDVLCCLGFLAHGARSGVGSRAPGARAWTGRRAAGDGGANRGDGAEGAGAGARPGPRA